MRILVIGSGGREHAICEALSKSKKLTKLYCAPGNAGISKIAEIVEMSPLDFEDIITFSKNNNIDLVFVAPDDPLSLGLVDRLHAENIQAFGPTKDAAIIEGSKSFAKEFMKRHDIPTAEYSIFNNYEKALAYLDNAKFPLVIKADGLALGKGVIICDKKEAAMCAIKSIMLDNQFGDAGKQIVIEEYLEGREATVLAFTDGYSIKCMPASQDHKKAFDGDKGLNTGGMGAFAPSPFYTPEIEKETMANIILPTIKGLRQEGRKFSGVLYFGLMMTAAGVKVIEYNARFGDPEAQTVLPLLKTDLIDIIKAIKQEKLKELDIQWLNNTVSLCVVAVSGGYPEKVVKGYPIDIYPMSDKVKLFHSGTAWRKGSLVTNGGRVICVTTLSKDMDSARQTIYEEIDKIKFTDMRYRKDIGVL